ncbi:hypothetical protein ACERII_10670 [Evansella sp. AB-rgal1]|uniref:hypothetical protein n=1 Tax=Evansella sp. AB-rgal1 TaxID=3242696 RepID=UPI00359E640B
MSSKSIFSFSGGIASIISGLFLASAHLINFIVGTEGSTVIGNSLVLFAHLGLIFAFVGIYEAQCKSNKSRVASNLGMILGVVGTTFVTVIVYFENAFASLLEENHAFDNTVWEMIFSVGPLFFVIGMIIVGISIVVGSVIPKIAGMGLVIGTIVFAMGTVIPSAEGILTVIGGGITGLSFMFVGLVLVSKGNRNSSSLHNRKVI